MDGIWVMAFGGNGIAVASLRGLVTDADLPDAEKEWPGLNDFLGHLPPEDRPGTFLELMWRFECWRDHERAA
jgi:hypothetical protein